MTGPLRSLSVLLTILALAALLAASAEAAETPRIYAITGATVVKAPGSVVEEATVVFRDGLIEAAGAGVQPPPDAVTIDGTGLWVYPGLIDASSELGLKTESGERGGGSGFGGARREIPAGAVHPIARIRPETRARDRLLPFDGDRKRDVERIRNLGFTVALVRPGRGILRGSSTAILLADDRPVAGMILRDDVAMHAAFEQGSYGEGYPTSLMGSIAALRQSFHDTLRHAEWSARYEADPAGMKRPDRNAAYAALGPVVGARQPIIFHTDHPQDTLMALRLGREFGLEVAVAVSSYEWEIAGRLADAGRPLIVSLGRPDKPDVASEDEALDVDRATMRRYLESPAGPARLHEAGVLFALTLDGLKNSADFHKRMGEILEAGLSEEDALAALTTVPAGLLGIDRVVGTLEPGKIANAVVTDGPLFEEETRIRHVFVDGIDYEIKVKEKPEGDPDAVVDPRGEWSVVFDMGSRTVTRTWTIGGEKDAWEGTAETRSGTITFDAVKLKGNVLTVTFPGQGGRPPNDVTVVIEGNEFEGTTEFGPRSVSVTGSRTSGPEGGER